MYMVSSIDLIFIVHSSQVTDFLKHDNAYEILAKFVVPETTDKSSPQLTEEEIKRSFHAMAILTQLMNEENSSGDMMGPGISRVGNTPNANFLNSTQAGLLSKILFQVGDMYWR